MGKENWRPVIISFIIIASLLLVSCGNDDSDETETPTNSTEQASTETVEPPETDEADLTDVPTEEAVQTEEPDVTSEAPLVNLSVSEDGAYFMSVSYALEGDALSEDAPEPPDEQRWTLVVASLTNEAGEEIEITRETLRLYDVDGEIYMPEEPSDLTSPPLVGTNLQEGESILGMVLFAVDQDVELDRLEWCLDTTCETTIEANIP